jgi:anti-anti-sigma regulatory factor
MGDISVLKNTRDEGRVMRLTGDLSIETASRLRNELLEALESAAPLEVDMGGAGSMDLACAQVLCSAHRSFHQAGQTMTLAGGVSESLRSSLAALSVTPGACGLPCAPDCLWKQGDQHE